MNNRFPGATTCPREHKESNIWDYLQISRRRCSRRNFKRHLMQVEVPVNSLLLKRNTARNIRVWNVHQNGQKRDTLPQGYCHRLCVLSPSIRRRSRATRRWCWLQHQQDEPYSSLWSGWPFSEQGERTSNRMSQQPSADWRWIRSSPARPIYQTHWKLFGVNTV